MLLFWLFSPDLSFRLIIWNNYFNCVNLLLNSPIEFFNFVYCILESKISIYMFLIFSNSIINFCFVFYLLAQHFQVLKNVYQRVPISEAPVGLFLLSNFIFFIAILLLFISPCLLLCLVSFDYVQDLTFKYCHFLIGPLLFQILILSYSFSDALLPI